MVMHLTVLMHPVKEAMVMQVMMLVIASACLNRSRQTQSCPRNSEAYEGGFVSHVVPFFVLDGS